MPSNASNWPAVAGWAPPSTGPATVDRSFLHNQLHTIYSADDSGVHIFTPAGGSIFSGNPNGLFDDGSKGICSVGCPDLLTPTGSDVTPVVNYQDVEGVAAGIPYDGSSGGGKVVCLGFPFEAITSSSVRSA